MVDEDCVGTAGMQGAVFMCVAIAGHVVVVIMQFKTRTWPWLGKWLDYMPDFDLRTVESVCRVLLSLPLGVVDRVQRAGLHRIVARTLYSPRRASVAVIRTVSIDESSRPG